MSLPYVKQRKTLTSLQQGIKERHITFGFIGGSITDARPRHNWPEFFISQFNRDYPQIRCRVENAAIGATGSDLAVFRVKRDLIERGCDVVFIEFAVNDEEVEPTRRFRTREGLIRQLLSSGIRDIVLVYTFSQGMREAIEQGRYPQSIADFEELAEHYQLPSIWVGKYGFDQVNKGRMTMDEWLPDGLHPKHAGSKLYAELVYDAIQKEIARKIDLAITSSTYIEPWDYACWEKIKSLPFSELKLNGQWLEYRWHGYEWIDTILESSRPDASFSFSFMGRGAVLVFDYGHQSLEFKYRINDGDWKDSNRNCPDWVGADGWYRLYELHSSLPIAVHTIEVVVRGEDNNNSVKHFRLGKVGILL